jgi:hypothetical protein
MTTAQATAEVFWTALMAMDARERRAFLERLVAEPSMREDLLDAAVIEDRKQEPTRPLAQVLGRSASRKAVRSRCATK